MTIKFIPHRLPSNRQAGISLLFTVVLLLALTLIAITITNSNQTQSVLVRNNQFRLEAFNISYTEIDAQIDAINQRNISQRVPPYIDALIRSDFNQKLNEGDNGLELLSTSSVSDAGVDLSSTGLSDEVKAAVAERDIALVYRGTCVPPGEAIAEDSKGLVCHELRIEVDTTLTNTSIGSSQRQVYEYISNADQ